MSSRLLWIAVLLTALVQTSCDGDNRRGDAGVADGPSSSQDAPGADDAAPPADAAGASDAAQVSDAAASDAAQASDAAVSDAAMTDAADLDAPLIDAPVIDAPMIDAADIDAGMFVEPSYDFLSETGLYDDIAAKVLVDEVVEFVPEFKLWSDNADKRRWIILPDGATIDTSNMDHWQFPVGTKIFKEFSHDVAGNTVLLETRLTEIWGPAANQIYQGTFVWNADDSDAAFARFGATNVKGTDHDAPAQSSCIRCHRGETSKVLGFQAVQLSHTGTPNIDDFNNLGWFTDAPAPGGYPVPGNATERAALGSLHANCGHCHNANYPGVANSACHGLPQLQLYVRTTDEMVTDTYAYFMTVDQPLVYWINEARGNLDGFTTRIVRGDPAASAVYYRMSVREAGQAPPRDDDQQMPPDFTDMVDADGLAAVEAWILSL